MIMTTRILPTLLVALAALWPAALKSQDVPRSGDEVWAYLASLPKDQRKAVIEREAAREGSFVLYGQLGIDRAEHLIKAFNARYPNIKFNFVRQTQADQSEKVMLEHRMGRVGGDVILTDTGLLYVLRDALAPYEPASWSDFDRRFLYGSVKDGWTAVIYELLPMVISWRTDRIPAADVPKSLDVLADPKWRGRVGTVRQFETFLEALTIEYGKEAAETKARNLARLNSRLYQSQAALSEGLGAGAVDIVWNHTVQRADLMKSGGQPVDWVFQEPAYGLSVTASALRLAKNPYTAALFLDFLLEAETLQKLEASEGSKRVFGNLKGKFFYDAGSMKTLRPYPPIAPERFKELNLIAEKLFIRKEF
jgi:iron(III) transport system substrate-binding protein